MFHSSLLSQLSGYILTTRIQPSEVVALKTWLLVGIKLVELKHITGIGHNALMVLVKPLEKVPAAPASELQKGCKVKFR